MLYLAIPSIRARWLSFAGVLASVGVSVALVTATGSLLESGIRGTVAPERLAGSPIVVGADQKATETVGTGDEQETSSAALAERVRLPLSAVARIAAVPGVARAVPDISFASALVRPDGSAVGGAAGLPIAGHAWASAALTPFDLVSGHAPHTDDDIVVDSALAHTAGLHVGSRIGLGLQDGTRPAVVSGLVTPRGDPGYLTHQSNVFTTDAVARAAYGRPGSVDLVGVQPAPGVDAAQLAGAIERAVGDGAVAATGAARGRLEHLETGDATVRLIAISGSLGGIGLAVAILVVAGMLGLAVQQRHREIALLRAMGATTRQVRRMLSRETLFVTAAGALLGLWPGVLLAGALGRALREHDLLPTTFVVHTGLLPMGAALASALVLSLSACALAARRATRIRPVEALAEAAAPARRVGIGRVLLGLVALAGTGVLFVVTQSMSAELAPAVVPGLFTTAIIAVALLAPVLTNIGTAIFGGLLPGPSGFLAGAGTRARSKQLAAAVTPFAVVVGVAGMTLLQHATLAHEGDRQSAARLQADHVVLAGPAGLPERDVRSLADTTGGTAIGLASTTVYAGAELDAYGARVVTPGALGRVLDLGGGPTPPVEPGQVALSRDVASALHTGVGRSVALRLGDGTQVQPTVVATFTRPLGFGDIVLPMADVEQHLTRPGVDLVLVRGGGAGAAKALTAFAGDHPGSRVGGAALVRQAEDADAATQAWVNYLLLGLMVVFAGFAVLNTLTLSIGARKRELALLRLVGTTRRQVVAMLRYEVATVVGFGVVAGVAVALVTALPFAKAATGSYRPGLPWLETGALVALAIALAWAGTMLPGRGALRPRPVDAIGIRE